MVTITPMFSLESTILFRELELYMKKLLTIGSLVGVLALAACGGGTEEEGTETETEETGTEGTETETETEDTETEDEGA